MCHEVQLDGVLGPRAKQRRMMRISSSAGCTRPPTAPTRCRHLAGQASCASQLRNLLELAVERLVTDCDYLYGHGEDERMAYALATAPKGRAAGR